MHGPSAHELTMGSVVAWATGVFQRRQKRHGAVMDAACKRLIRHGHGPTDQHGQYVSGWPIVTHSERYE